MRNVQAGAPGPSLPATRSYQRLANNGKLGGAVQAGARFLDTGTAQVSALRMLHCVAEGLG